MRELNRCSGGADFIFIPERPPKVMPWEGEMCAEIHRVSFPSPFPLYLTQSFPIRHSTAKWANEKPSS